MSDPRRGRKTIYKGIEMRSRLEAGFAAWLDRWNFSWEYEPQVFANEDGQYYPDFRIDDVPIATTGLSRVWIEIKPSGWKDEGGRLAKAMSVIYESDTSALRVLQRRGSDPLLHLGDTWLPMRWVMVCGFEYPTACFTCEPDRFKEQQAAMRNAPKGRVGLAFAAVGAAEPWDGAYWEGPA